jgi:hypothetical protein
MTQQGDLSPGLMLRSHAQRGVSKHEAVADRAALALRDAGFARSSG